MRDEIILAKPFEFIDYVSIEGFQGIGQHGIFKISGHIKDENEKKYIHMLLDEIWVQVAAQLYSGERKNIFKGIVIDMRIERSDGICLLTLILATGSYLMDIKKHIRSFQNEDINYRSIMNIITEEYLNRSCVMSVGADAPIPGLILQYEETDWQFARRIASHFDAEMIADSSYEGIKVYFGMPEGREIKEINTNEYKVVRKGREAYDYYVKVREIFYMGEKISLNGNILSVAGIRTELKGSELYHTYRLVHRQRLRKAKIYNEKAIGAALDGTITKVERDKVQIQLDKDENAGQAGKRWFEYATPYSSPDGTGWYCMPEAGDKVRLKIPAENECEAYVASAVHLDAASGGKRSNPDYKSLMNKQGKEILFTPHSLIMTNNAGLSIELLDDEGIRIISNKDITFQADENIEITSVNAKLELDASENVCLKQGNIRFDMSGNTCFNGGKLNLN